MYGYGAVRLAAYQRNYRRSNIFGAVAVYRAYIAHIAVVREHEIALDRNVYIAESRLAHVVELKAEVYGLANVDACP